MMEEGVVYDTESVKCKQYHNLIRQLNELESTYHPIKESYSKAVIGMAIKTVYRKHDLECIKKE